MAKANSNVVKMAGLGDRKADAMQGASMQLEAVLSGIVALERMQLGEIPEWPQFDMSAVPDIVRALAIRGATLNRAVMSASRDEISVTDLEALVRHG